MIRLAVRPDTCCPPSLRTVEDLLYERGIESHEAVRAWWPRFGPRLVVEFRRRRMQGPRASRWRWHLDETFVRIDAVQPYRWRAVDEGRVLKAFVTSDETGQPRSRCCAS